MSTFLEELKQYKESISTTSIIGNKVVRRLVEAIKPIIPDIEGSLGWAEGGIDMVCLFSDSHSVFKVSGEDTLDNLIEETFPEFNDTKEWYDTEEISVYTPFGVYLTPDEFDKIKNVLFVLKHGDGK